MIVFRHKGNFEKTSKFLNKMKSAKYTSVLLKYGQIGVQALASATPMESGKTAGSWSYKIEETNGGATIAWYNTNNNQNVNIALILQYGHGTGTGGYVAGRDYINPAIRPVFDNMTEEIWKEVAKA